MNCIECGRPLFDQGEAEIMKGKSHHTVAEHEGWEKKFDSMFITPRGCLNLQAVSQKGTGNLRTFIRTLITQAKQEAYDEGYKTAGLNCKLDHDNAKQEGVEQGWDEKKDWSYQHYMKAKQEARTAMAEEIMEKADNLHDIVSGIDSFEPDGELNTLCEQVYGELNTLRNLLAPHLTDHETKQ